MECRNYLIQSKTCILSAKRSRLPWTFFNTKIMDWFTPRWNLTICGIFCTDLGRNLQISVELMVKCVKQSWKHFQSIHCQQACGWRCILRTFCEVHTKFPIFMNVLDWDKSLLCFLTSLRCWIKGLNASSQMYLDLFSKDVVCLQPGSNFQFTCKSHLHSSISHTHIIQNRTFSEQNRVQSG